MKAVLLNCHQTPHCPMEPHLSHTLSAHHSPLAVGLLKLVTGRAAPILGPSGPEPLCGPLPASSLPTDPSVPDVGESIDPIRNFIDEIDDASGVVPSDLFEAYKGFIKSPPHSEESLALDRVRPRSSLRVESLQFSDRFSLQVLHQPSSFAGVLPPQRSDESCNAIAEKLDRRQRGSVGFRHVDPRSTHGVLNSKILAPKSREHGARPSAKRTAVRQSIYGRLMDATRAIFAEGREARRIARFLAPQLAELVRRTAADGLTLTAAALFAVGFPLSLYALATAVPS